MDKKILFVSESGFIGKLPRNFTNTRTEIAWQIALNADHCSFGGGHGDSYDLIILIIPKDISKIHNFYDLLYSLEPMLKENNGKLAIMQEGPNWYFQDYSVNDQFKYYTILSQADFLLCHNDADVKYYAGLTGKPSYVFQSLMIEDTVKDINKDIKRDGVMIGGNFVSWYGGFDSYVVSNEFDCKKYVPRMGRATYEERSIEDLNILPYTHWTDWIKNLNKVKYSVHLMRTHAAGTFFLNTAYLGIPSIGYYGLDTAQILHPSLCVDVGDITRARVLANRLKEDEKFYKHCSTECKMMYEMFYTEEVFIRQFKKILINEGILDEEEI